MIQVSLIGYAVAGAFLGMSHFDLPYHLMIILILAATSVNQASNLRQATLGREKDRITGNSMVHRDTTL